MQVIRTGGGAKFLRCLDLNGDRAGTAGWFDVAPWWCGWKSHSNYSQGDMVILLCSNQHCSDRINWHEALCRGGLDQPEAGRRRLKAPVVQAAIKAIRRPRACAPSRSSAMCRQSRDA